MSIPVIFWTKNKISKNHLGIVFIFSHTNLSYAFIKLLTNLPTVAVMFIISLMSNNFYQSLVACWSLFCFLTISILTLYFHLLLFLIYNLYYIFHYHLVPLQPPPPSNHRPVIHVHKSFTHFYFFVADLTLSLAHFEWATVGQNPPVQLVAESIW